METWAEIMLLIQAIADSRDDPGVYGMRTPGPDIEIRRDILVTPGGSWGSTKAFQLFLEGLGEWLDDAGVSNVSTIYAKLDELIDAYNQLRSDYNSSTVPTSAPSVAPLP